jgi:hypothetical protein
MSNNEALVGINVNGRIYYGSPKTIDKIRAKMNALKEKASRIGRELKEARLGPSTHRNQLSTWIGQPKSMTAEQVMEVKLARMISRGRF